MQVTAAGSNPRPYGLAPEASALDHSGKLSLLSDIVRNASCPRVQCSVDAHGVRAQVKKDEHGSRLTSANQHHIVIATALASFHSIVVPRGLEPRTLRLLTVRSNQLSYETSGNAVRFSHPKKCPSKHKTKHADQLRTTVQPSFFGMEPKPIPNLLVPTLRSNGIPIRGLRVPNC